MFAWPLRTKLDILRPVSIPNSPQHRSAPGVRLPAPVFQTGDRVWARNYHGSRKWVAGQILKVLGSRTYIVRTTQGLQWKRHVDQLRPGSSGAVSADDSGVDDDITWPVDSPVLTPGPPVPESQGTPSSTSELPSTSAATSSPGEIPPPTVRARPIRASRPLVRWEPDEVLRRKGEVLWSDPDLLLMRECRRRLMTSAAGSPSDSISLPRNFCFGQYENDQRDCLKYSEHNSSPTSCSEGSFLSYQVNIYEVDNLFSCLENRDETVPPTPTFPSSPETPYVRTTLSYTQVTEGRPPFSTLADINKSHETQNYKKSLNSTVLLSDCSIVTNLPSVMTEMQGSYAQRPSSTTCNRHESASDDDDDLWMIRNPRPSLYTQSRNRSLVSDPQSAECPISLLEKSLWTPESTSKLLILTAGKLESAPSDLKELTDDTNDNLDLNRTGIAVSRPLLCEMRADSLTSTNNSPKVVRDKFSVIKDYANGQRRLNLQLVEKKMHAQHPFLEKKRISEEHSFGSNSLSSGFSSSHSDSTVSIPFPNVLLDFSKVESKFSLPETSTDKHMAVKFVQDTSKFWYKPDISRDQAIAVLKEKEPGSFIIRDSHSFRGAYGLAMKVATTPPSVMQLRNKAEDMTNELVRHFLIECVHKGVRLKGCPNEPYFGSLTALVYQHSITPLALPCKLLIPSKDPLEEITETTLQTAANSAAGLLKQGAACNVWYLNSVEMESLTGYQAVQKALNITQLQEPPAASTVVHFKVSSQGITITDNQRKLFFRRHYPVSTVIFCSLDPQDRKWIKDGLSAKVFGFVARKGIVNDNVCHLFAEHDPEQPASAIVNFVSKVMIGSQKKI
ncbi:tensin-3 [Rhinophrynus dorsalis]